MCSLQTTHLSDAPTIISNPGSKGRDGTIAGEGGLGGVRGKNCEGIFYHYNKWHSRRGWVYNPTGWQIAAHHVPLPVDAARARSGSKPTGLNTVGQQRPLEPVEFD